MIKNKLQNLIISAIVFIGITNSVMLLNTSFKAYQENKDEMQALKLKYEKIGKLLPPQSKIGFMTDESIQDDYEKAFEIYSKARYWLSPVVVKMDTKEKLILGVFEKVPSKEYFSQKGLVIEKSFPDGTAIIRNNNYDT